ncbi:hypothetical protein J4Q44_G00082370 [Coregonus suidteri]|uniref:Uncharacterized protein n=1 Tax=Coregonus suidteri TaxID=861788 RepID=A0AAN8R1T2_9TELE
MKMRTNVERQAFLENMEGLFLAVGEIMDGESSWRATLSRWCTVWPSGRFSLQNNRSSGPTVIRVVCRHIRTNAYSSDDDIPLPIPVCPRDHCTEV